MRFVKGLCVLALAVCVAGSVYAETQSVKISGDLTIRSYLRNDYDLDMNHAEESLDPGKMTNARIGNQDDWQTFFTTATEVQIDADLTDNVAAVIRLVNQRAWDVRAKAIGYTTLFTGTGGYFADDNEFDVGVDLAYIELQEFLYSPLTLRVGRQDIWMGKGFVVGLNQQVPQGALPAPEYTAINSFDALRSTLDYDPWTIDMVAAKILENDLQSQDDVDLYGINVGYIFDSFNAESEAYWFYKRDKSIENWNIKDANTVHTMGLRGSMDPIEDLTVGTEVALQWGKYVGSREQLESRDRSAWAIDASIESRQLQEMFDWKPRVGFEYIYYSGHKNIGDENPRSEGTYTGWDPMFRGKFDSAIREFMGSYYLSNQDVNNQRGTMTPSYPDASYTNQHQIIAIASVEPTDSLTVDARYLHYWQQYHTYHWDINAGANGQRIKDDTYLGSEIDIEVTWDYTEDVSFGMLAAWYFPGAHYYDQSDDVATDVVGTVKLSF